MLSSRPFSNIFVSENLACGAPVHVTESSTRSIWETALKKPVLITEVVVGVVIRSVEWYDLMKIKPTESEVLHYITSKTLILLTAPSLAIKWKLHCQSRKQKRKNKPMTMFDSKPCDLLVLPLLLPTPTTQFHWIVSDGVVNGIGRNGNVLILPTPIPSSLWLRLRLRFSIFTGS